MDFMPEEASREQVETFVALCGKAADISPNAYMARMLEDDIDSFINYFTQWSEKQKGKVTA
jgi:hypothetical protein